MTDGGGGMQRLSRKISFSPSVTLTVSPNLVRVITLDCAPLSGQHPFLSHLGSHDELLNKKGMAKLLDEGGKAELLDEIFVVLLDEESAGLVASLEDDSGETLQQVVSIGSVVAMDDELSGVTSGIAGLDEEPSHAKNTSDMAARYAKIFFIIPPLFLSNLVLVITLLLPAVFFG
jgi:hypothetical protein